MGVREGLPKKATLKEVGDSAMCLSNRLAFKVSGYGHRVQAVWCRRV